MVTYIVVSEPFERGYGVLSVERNPRSPITQTLEVARWLTLKDAENYALTRNLAEASRESSELAQAARRSP